METNKSARRSGVEQTSRAAGETQKPLSPEKQVSKSTNLTEEEIETLRELAKGNISRQTRKPRTVFSLRGPGDYYPERKLP